MSRRWKVNIRLLPVKAHYFFYCAAAAALTPFLPVIGKQMGISEIEIGIIYAVAPILSIIAKPTVGVLADRLKKRKNFFLFFILLAMMSSLCISFLPQVKPVRPVLFQCGQGSNYFRQCDSNTFSSECVDKFEKMLWRKEGRLENIDEAPRTSTSTSANVSSSPSSLVEVATASSISQDPVLELCHVRCEIHGYMEGVHFCDNLIVDQPPPMCISKKTTVSSKDKDNYEENRNTSESDPANETLNSQVTTFVSPKLLNIIQNRTLTASPKRRGYPAYSAPDLSADDEQTDSYHDPKPYVLEFDANLKIAHADLLEDGCLYLPVDTIGFLNGQTRDEFQKFACLPVEVFLQKCYIDCPKNPDLNSHLERILGEPESFQSSTFWSFGLLVVISVVALSIVSSLSDALCFQLLEDKPELYGRQRQLAAIGWGASTLITGYLIDSTSQGKLLKDYTPCYYILGGLFVLDLIMSYKWEIKEVDKPKSQLKNICLLANDLRIIVFFFVCILMGMCTGIHWNFLFWYLEDIATASCTKDWLKLLQGLMVATQCLAEIPFFYYAGWFIKKLGHVHCLSLSLLAFGLRLLIYSTLTHPWAFVPTELFQGITFGLFYSVMATYASEISPKGSHATVQGIVGAGFEGLGIASGSLVAGVLFKTWGGKTAFRLFGIGAVIFCILHVVIMHVLGKKRIYGIPISDTEVEGQEMYKVNGVGHDVEMETESE